MAKLETWVRVLLRRWREKREKASMEEVDTAQRREKITVFAISWVLAIGLWFLVNLSKNFTVSVQFPLEWGEVEAGKAPMQQLPEKVEATIFGEGWVILSLKNSRPTVKVDAQSGDVNVYEMIRVIMNNYPQAAVTKVFPSTISVQLDEKSAKKVPVRPRASLLFSPSHDLIGEAYVRPDSVVLTGAKALLETIQYWDTESVEFKNVKETIRSAIPLKTPSDVLQLSIQEVEFRATVSEFTEGEVRVPVKVQGVPQGRSVTFSPSVISIRYDVPVGDYAGSQTKIPFEARVEWSEIANDSSGFASPTIVDVGRNMEIRLRSYQPRRVAYYFNVAAQK